MEHWLQIRQLPEQSTEGTDTGHASVLQVVYSTDPSDTSQVTPPFSTIVVTAKTRDCDPLPQVRSHAENDPQLPTQLTAGSEQTVATLHAVFSTVPSEAAHVLALPPFAAGVLTVYVRD